MKDHVHVLCPICGNEISIPILWETERGEFGVILSEYPVVDSDSSKIDRHGHCYCDFNKTLFEVMAEYFNDGDRLYGLLFPHLDDRETAEMAESPSHKRGSAKPDPVDPNERNV